MRFENNGLAEWRPVEAAEYFPADAGAVQTVAFALLASDPVEVYATDESGEQRLVAFGAGKLKVRFSARGPCEVTVSGEASVFVNRRAAPQVVEPPIGVSFTTIEPRTRGVSDDLRRLMHFAAINSRRRERELQAQIDALREASARVVEPAP